MQKGAKTMASAKEKKTYLQQTLQGNLEMVRNKLVGTSDLLIREITVSGIPVGLVMCEGMINIQTMAEILIEPLCALKLPDKDPHKLMDWIENRWALAADQAVIYTLDDVFRFMMSGFVVLLIDGVPCGVVMGMQGFNFRGISEPTTEVNVRGSHEGFVEPLRINLTMVRRRIKSPSLKFELGTVGSRSKTDYCLCYLKDKVSDQVLEELKHRLSQVNLDIILDSTYLIPFLENKPASIFSQIGLTERPDVLCAKIAEGRIAVLVDSTPFALILPYLFSENFQCLDDYTHRPYYATFIRWLKYLSFFFSILLPGFYVAISKFHPSLFPHALLYNIAASEETTPFPIFAEALLIFFLYEVMREAGLRLPKAIGHAVSIVGALVIGDAAVSAGIIGSPMVMVVALTAISAFVVPSLYESVTVLRFAFIFIGGFWGLLGIMLGIAVVGMNLCAQKSFGVPITAPITPFNLYQIRDVLIRANFKRLAKTPFTIQNMPGSDVRTQNKEKR